MTSPAPLTLLTEEEIVTLCSTADFDSVERTALIMIEEFNQLVAMARLSITLQRRVEELEEELERSENHRVNAGRPDVLFCTTHQRYYHQRKHCARCLREP